tara:strand:+ start:1628 stop:2623 length:996 start_codon:yes stop_codon:yes gene_type:complete
MHIFIDESGTFALSERATSVSAVGALVIPTGRLPYFERLYSRLRPSLSKHNGEVKGRLLDEAQIGQVVALLRRVGAFFEVVAIDMGLHDQEAILGHKKKQEHAVTGYLTEEHHPNVVAGVWDLRRRLEEMPLQLYVQATAQTALIYDVLGHAQLYFAVRAFRELGMFNWVIDAKGKGGTVPWEQWWQTAVLPMIESQSLRKPFPAVIEGNYTAMKRFQREPSEYKLQFSGGDHSSSTWFDLRLAMMESMRFSDVAEPGLEAVDILTNAIRRSLAGNLSRSGWIPISRIMINRHRHAIRLISLNDAEVDGSRLPYAPVVRDFNRCGISMFPK